MHTRKVVSLTTFLAFVAMALTGTVLYVVPQGRIARWTGWTLAGLSKDQWSDLHIASALLFLVVGVWHTVLNWKPIVCYLQNRSQRLRIFTPHALGSLAITALVILMAHFHVPPLKWVLDYGASLKNRAASTRGEPPYGHAEESTVATIAGHVGMAPGQVIEALRKAGLDVEDKEQSLAAVAQANGITPQQVFEAIRPPRSQGAGSGRKGEAPAGVGRRTVAELCADLGVSVDRGVAVLRAAGFDLAAPDVTLKAVAEPAGRRPMELYELLRALAPSPPPA